MDRELTEIRGRDPPRHRRSRASPLSYDGGRRWTPPPPHAQRALSRVRSLPSRSRGRGCLAAHRIVTVDTNASPPQDHIPGAHKAKIGPHLQIQTQPTHAENMPPQLDPLGRGGGARGTERLHLFGRTSQTQGTRASQYTQSHIQAEVGRDREQEEGRQKSHRRLRLGRRPP